MEEWRTWRIWGSHNGGYEEYYLLEYSTTYFHAGILFSLFLDPEDGGNMFLQNVCWLSLHGIQSKNIVSTLQRTWYHSAGDRQIISNLRKGKGEGEQQQQQIYEKFPSGQK
jgi:hypothetical protein